MSATPASREELEQWQLEYRLVNDALTRCEEAERAILRSLRCPTDPAAVYTIVAGRVSAPWPTRGAARSRQRALHAMHTLALVAEARRYFALGEENSRLAAFAAFRAGLLANDTAINAVLGLQVQRQRRNAGRVRGTMIRQDAARHDQAIRRYFAQWARDEDLHEEHPSPATYVHLRLPEVSRRTIERRLHVLKLRRPARRRTGNSRQ
jgi:hypothetical protein